MIKECDEISGLVAWSQFGIPNISCFEICKILNGRHLRISVAKRRRKDFELMPLLFPLFFRNGKVGRIHAGGYHMCCSEFLKIFEISLTIFQFLNYFASKFHDFSFEKIEFVSNGIVSFISHFVAIRKRVANFFLNSRRYIIR